MADQALKNERLKIPFPIIVEGKYDKLRIESVAEAQILTTDGFGVFRGEEKKMLFRALAERTPILVLTDSDGAGKLIRSYLTGILPADKLIQLYVPRVEGKEKRKNTPSAEGILGVEGMENDLLRSLLTPYADPEKVNCRQKENPLSKTDFYVDGLTGGERSAEKRDELCAKLGLPPHMTPNALLAALRMLCGYTEYCRLVGRNLPSNDGEKKGK